jgi:hypothetical protein
MAHTRYLGDGLYADFNDGHQIVLTTGSHKLEEAVNIIYLEPEVYQALVEWMDVIQQEAIGG